MSACISGSRATTQTGKRQDAKHCCPEPCFESFRSIDRWSRCRPPFREEHTPASPLRGQDSWANDPSFLCPAEQNETDPDRSHERTTRTHAEWNMNQSETKFHSTSPLSPLAPFISTATGVDARFSLPVSRSNNKTMPSKPRSDSTLAHLQPALVPEDGRQAGGRPLVQ